MRLQRQIKELTEENQDIKEELTAECNSRAKIEKSRNEAQIEVKKTNKQILIN